jgi:hypothetical protein
MLVRVGWRADLVLICFYDLFFFFFRFFNHSLVVVRIQGTSKQHGRQA